MPLTGLVQAVQKGITSWNYAGTNVPLSALVGWNNSMDTKEYSYDLNENLTQYFNKWMISITYHLLYLSQSVALVPH